VNAIIRTRGFASGGYNNGSGWFEEKMLDTTSIPLFILSQSLHYSASGGFGFILTGQPGRIVEIQASSKLTNGVPLATNTNASGSMEFTDQTNSLQERFYRARYFP